MGETEENKEVEKKEEHGKEEKKEKKKKKEKDGEDGEKKEKKKKNPEDKNDPAKLKAKLEKIETKMKDLAIKKEEILNMIKEAEKNAASGATEPPKAE